ncbi:haloalkane dehalogenase [Hyphobacterium sp. SN044]|uniref:haloalkane dehalogenase n=1 Tax=Hyphobacterium sp. SN044 TaxID=2912575 RepID=UPI001F02A176|nr:haloalkane dehalogenase [Hyphobacterium sp. SN044]MCF8879085.1 haloalkane dehalogenase [Hyphobacterium sp. SN044]
MIDALRTPEDRFKGLPDWDYEPHYIDDLKGYEGLRVHYVDEGPKDGPVFLCLHGEPSWAYLYRKMIPVFLKAGGRVIAPDFLGFGRSDKPVDDAVYTFHFHRNFLKAFLDRMDLHDICLVCQDWGGLLGLTLPMDYPDRFTRLIVMNTGIGVGMDPGPGFMAWRDYVATNPEFNVGDLMKRATPILTEAEVAAYQAPFPDPRYMGGVRRFPALVPINPSMEGVDTGMAAAKFWSQDWSGDSFMAIGMQDPVLGPPAMRALHKLIRNCPEPMEIADGGHFVQEWGEPIAEAACKKFGML